MIGSRKFQKLANPSRGRGCRTTHAQSRTDALQSPCSMRIQIKIRSLPWNSIPEVNVRFVPHLEVPRCDFFNAVSLNEMLGKVPHQIVPSIHILGRRYVRLVPERMKCIRIEGEFFRHETDFNEWLDAIFKQPVANLIDIREVINRIAVIVLVINADFVVKDGMESNVLEISHLFHRADVVTIALAQREDSPPRSEHLLPEMRKRRRLLRCVNVDRFLPGPARRKKQQGRERQNQ